jgi:hypothetical protein
MMIKNCLKKSLSLNYGNEQKATPFYKRCHSIKVLRNKKPSKANAIKGFVLWCLQESNQGHKDFQSFALPTELRHQPYLWVQI